MKRNTALSAGLILAVAVGIQGCAAPAKVTNADMNPAAVQTGAAQPVLAGKVIETMNAGGYTYVLLEKDGAKGWSAVPATEIKVGDELELLPGAEMGPFTSKALNRTFDQLVFSGGLKAKPGQQAALPSGHPGMPGAPTSKDAPAAKQAAPVEPFYSGKVAETVNAGAYTYILLENDGKTKWAAIPATAVKVGDEVEVRPGTEMGNFRSNTLNRTFDNITFSAGMVQKK